jgi:uncharacterized protein YjcR
MAVKKKRGGQPGNRNAKSKGAPKKNQNAAGHGAPKGNRNAETHGAYSTVHLENLSPEEQKYIEGVELNAKENMLLEYKLLLAKERDLISKIKNYEKSDIDFHVDKIIITSTQKGKVEQTFKSSSFERVMKLEAEYSKTHGRILKLLDSIRAHENDRARLDLDNRRHEFNKQRISGEIKINPATNEINDSYEENK